MNNFKNAILFRMSRDVIIPETIEQSLEAFRFTPCSSQDMASSGWVPPMGPNYESLTHQANGQILITAQKEEKILPSAVIRAELDKRVSKLEAEQARKLKKTEKDALKDEVLHTLLPRAFSRNTKTSIWIDTTNGVIAVDAASARRTEDVLALLRKSLGSLPVVPLTLENPIEMTITDWVRSGDLPAGFALGDEAELKSILEGGGIGRFKMQDLVSDEISTHIEAGKMVTKLALNWQERIDFVLSDNGTLRRIKFCDSLLEQNDDIDREDVGARFDADFCLMTGELSTLFKDLTAALGGEASR